MAPTSAIYLCLGIAKIFFLGTRNNQDRISYISTWRKILISHFFFFFEKKRENMAGMNGGQRMYAHFSLRLPREQCTPFSREGENDATDKRGWKVKL